MRTTSGLSALALVAVVAAACSGSSTPTATPTTAPTTAASQAASEAPSEAPSAAPSQVAVACTPDTMATKTAGKLTIGTDNPAYPPYYQPSAASTAPWELGDPTNRLGFEGRVAWTIARDLGYIGDTVTWIPVPFNNAIQPGPKDFDIYLTQVSYTADRAQAVDLSDGYYDVAQAVVAAKGSKLAKVTSIAGLKGFQFGAQAGTTSLDTINSTIAPSKEAKIYDTNDLAVEALKNGQIDGLVVDLPTAFYITSAQYTDGVIAGQFPAQSGGEHFSVVLDKGSPLTACVNTALKQMHDSGELGRITTDELSTNAGAPVYQP
jgi:polar amino acid transport system substrate-binding protein